ncbi:MAG: biotin--[acetyl-CoA-carboxylase] ligase [Bryobacteraceae bacterium]|jgi:BirA family biotin operon repressor/biotin-[acetyl-CoA-carboxylase] ligase
MDIERLRREFPSRRIHHYATVDSTMRAAVGLEPGSVVLADRQTAGQGRHGRWWHSEAGSGIYCSIVLKPAPALTLALGLATADAIARSTGMACDLRWPNDVMLAGKKVAGILVQNAIAGIGINVNQTSFPPELASEATSLRLHTDAPVSLTAIILALLPAVDRFVELDKDTILRLFTRASSYAAGRRVTVAQPDGIIEGTTTGLDPAGFLMVRKDDGTDTLIVAGGVRAAGS